MALSASIVLGDGLTQVLLGAQVGNKGNFRSGNRAVRTGFRCEVKSNVEVDEKMCSVSGQKCVMPQSARRNCGGPAEAARCALNDAMLMCTVAQNIDERARNDFLMLLRCVLPRIVDHVTVPVVAHSPRTLYNDNNWETNSIFKKVELPWN